MEPFGDVVDDVLTTVRIVPRWPLPADGWPDVEAALAALQQAFESGDARQVRRAGANLESLGPVTRLAAISGRPGAPPRVPPPPSILELVNTLIHPSGGWGSQAGTDSNSTADR